MEGFREWLKNMFEIDEQLWTEKMAELSHEKRHEDMDFENLEEILLEMARRERREVKNRLAVLILHLLKRQHYGHTEKSWQNTIIEQRNQLNDIFLNSQTLMNYAQVDLPKAYADAVRTAAGETSLPPATFPLTCPWTIQQITTHDDT